MRDFLIKTLLTTIGPALIVVSMGAVWFAVARADLRSSWLSAAAPQVTKISDLPANTVPAQANRDCTDTTYLRPDLTQTTGCFVASKQGLIERFGSALIPPNSQTGFPLTIVAPPNNSYLIPIPGRQQVLLISPANGIGNYISVYDDLAKVLTPSYDAFPLRHLSSYDVTGLPNRTITDKAGNRIAFNVYGTLSFSANGKWAVIDAPTRGLLRINLDTFEVTPFANSFNGPNDYADKAVVTAVSNDGRYIATAFYQYGEFKLYDMSSCSGSTDDYYTQPLNCQFRDYWSAMASVTSSFKNIYRLRFANDDNLSLDLTYDWQSSSSFHAATFRLTAPGTAAHSLDYLALGDSYISGQGEFIYKSGTDTDTNNCHLSALAYPYIIGAAHFNSYNSIACSGARTNDISGGHQASGKDSDSYDAEIFDGFLPGYRAQLAFIERYQPNAVTISIGGNDIGFSKLLQACAVPQFGLPPVSNTCFDNYYDRMQVVQAIQAAYPKIQSSISAIIKADPGVRLYIVGYPQIVAIGSCALNVHLNNEEITFSEHLVAYLNSIIQKAAQSSGALYVDVENGLDGHRMCETSGDQVAINGLTRGNDGGPFGINVFGSESFHPNVLGHQLLAQAIERQTNGLGATMPPVAKVVPPSVNDPLAQILLNNYVIGTRPVPQIGIVDDTIADDTVTRSAPIQVAVDGRANGLQPNTGYQLSLGTANSSTVIGSFVTDSSSNLAASVTMPAGLANGSQTIRIEGINSAGQTIVIYKYIYVIASADDYDGNGVANDNDQCLAIQISGIDADSDGIDDACDPQITVTTKPLIGQVYLTGNIIEAR